MRTSLLWLTALLALTGVSACGLKGKLKTPDQIETDEAKKNGTYVKKTPADTNAATNTAAKAPPPIVPAATGSIFRPNTGSVIFLPPAEPPPETGQ